MLLNVYFDASFNFETKTAVIAVRINNTKKNIFVSVKKISCNNSTEAELRALNKIINYIDVKQNSGLIPINCKIVIRGDNKSVIDCMNKNRHIRCIEKGIMVNLLNRFTQLKKSNSVNLIWIRRKYNYETHKLTKTIV